MRASLRQTARPQKRQVALAGLADGDLEIGREVFDDVAEGRVGGDGRVHLQIGGDLDARAGLERGTLRDPSENNTVNRPILNSCRIPKWRWCMD